MLTQLGRFSSGTRWCLQVCIALFGAVIALLPTGRARAQTGQPVENNRILYLGARAKADAKTALPRRLAEVIDRGVGAQIAKAGATVLRPAQRELNGCHLDDYQCIVTSRQDFDLLVDVRVQKNSETSYYVTLVLIERAKPGEGTQDNFPYISASEEASPPQNVNAEDGLAGLIAQRVSQLLEHQHREVAKPPIAASTVHKPSQVKLTVSVEGAGQVISSPPGISCGISCESEFPRGAEPVHVALEGQPRGANILLGWNQTGCTADKPCDLYMSNDQQISVRFGRSIARKALTGVLGGLAIAGLAAGAVAIGLDGRDYGSCETGGLAFADCKFRTWRAGALTLGIAVALGTGAALAWWLPNRHR